MTYPLETCIQHVLLKSADFPEGGFPFSSDTPPLKKSSRLFQFLLLSGFFHSSDEILVPKKFFSTDSISASYSPKQQCESFCHFSLRLNVTFTLLGNSNKISWVKTHVLFELTAVEKHISCLPLTASTHQINVSILTYGSGRQYFPQGQLHL